MIKVANRYTDGTEGVNIMRPSIFGNPYQIKEGVTQEQAIELFRGYLWREIKQKSRVYRELMKLVERHKSGQDITLVCCCAPKPCHGDVLKAAIEFLEKETR